MFRKFLKIAKLVALVVIAIVDTIFNDYDFETSAT